MNMLAILDRYDSVLMFGALIIFAFLCVALGIAIAILWSKRMAKLKSNFQSRPTANGLQKNSSAEMIEATYIEPVPGDISGLLTSDIFRREVSECVGNALGSLPESMRRMEEVVFILQSYRVSISSIEDDVLKIQAGLMELSGKTDWVAGSVVDQLKAYLEKERRKREAEQQEEQNKRQKEATKDRLALCTRLFQRLDSLFKQSTLLQISSVTSEIINELKKVPHYLAHSEGNLSRYLEVSALADNLRTELGEFETLPQLYIDDTQNGIQTKIGLLEQLLDKLNKEHRAIWFLNLLEEASRYPFLQQKTDSLKRLLDLEEIEIASGCVPLNLNDLDIVSTDGMGKRTVISEVLESGFRVSGGGAVIKKPKVKVRLEN